MKISFRLRPNTDNTVSYSLIQIWCVKWDNSYLFWQIVVKLCLHIVFIYFFLINKTQFIIIVNVNENKDNKYWTKNILKCIANTFLKAFDSRHGRQQAKIKPGMFWYVVYHFYNGDLISRRFLLKFHQRSYENIDNLFLLAFPTTSNTRT